MNKPELNKYLMNLIKTCPENKVEVVTDFARVTLARGLNKQLLNKILKYIQNKLQEEQIQKEIMNYYKSNP